MSRVDWQGCFRQLKRDITLAVSMCVCVVGKVLEARSF